MDQKADVELLYEDTVSAEGIEEFERRVAERIRSLRQQRGLTLQKLAERARVSKSMISKVERGEASPSAGTMSRLADGLGFRSQPFWANMIAIASRFSAWPTSHWPTTPYTDGRGAPCLRCFRRMDSTSS